MTMADTDREVVAENGAETGEMGIEKAFEELQELLSRMDEEGVSLEESFKCYERGMKLIRYCNDTIDKVEKKVMILSAEGKADEF